jgi:transketolase
LLLLRNTISLEVLEESVSRVLALTIAPQEELHDSFGESGTPAQLMDKYKLNNRSMLQLKKVIARK